MKTCDTVLSVSSRMSNRNLRQRTRPQRNSVPGWPVNKPSMYSRQRVLWLLSPISLGSKADCALISIRTRISPEPVTLGTTLSGGHRPPASGSHRSQRADFPHVLPVFFLTNSILLLRCLNLPGALSSMPLTTKVGGVVVSLGCHVGPNLLKRLMKAQFKSCADRHLGR